MPQFLLHAKGFWGETGLALEQHGSECGPFGRGGAPKGGGAEPRAGSQTCHSRNHTPARRVRLPGRADGAKPKRFRRSWPSFFLPVPSAQHPTLPHLVTPSQRSRKLWVFAVVNTFPSIANLLIFCLLSFIIVFNFMQASFF